MIQASGFPGIRALIFPPVAVINWVVNSSFKIDTISRRGSSAGGLARAFARLLAGAAMGKDFAEPVELQAIGHIGDTGIDNWASALMRFDNAWLDTGRLRWVASVSPSCEASSGASMWTQTRSTSFRDAAAPARSSITGFNAVPSTAVLTSTPRSAPRTAPGTRRSDRW